MGMGPGIGRTMGYGSGPAGKVRPSRTIGPRKAPSYNNKTGFGVSSSSKFGTRGTLSRGFLGRRGR
jgi:hypothetical protein